MVFLLHRQKARAPAIADRILNIEGRSIPLTVRQNPRAARITLRIEPGGRALKMTIPPGLSERDVAAFIERHRGWMAARLEKLDVHPGLGHGAFLSLRGVPHRIHQTGQLRGLTEATEIQGEPVLSVSGHHEYLGRRLVVFLKKEARRDLEPLVQRHGSAIGRRARSITLKDTRSRWGSCSFEGNLSFSWRIVMAPPLVIDYLAAHEVAHLKEMNHGPAFWSLCRSLCPQMEEAKQWLKRHGSALHAIDFS